MTIGIEPGGHSGSHVFLRIDAKQIDIDRRESLSLQSFLYPLDEGCFPISSRREKNDVGPVLSVGNQLVQFFLSITEGRCQW